MPAPNAVLFDIGGVAVEWDPRFLYRTLFDAEDEMERFLGEVCTLDWNDELNAGRPFAEAIAELAADHPDQAELIEAYGARWPEMLGDVIEGTVEVVHDLRAKGVPVFALTNWSAETWPIGCARHPMHDWFEGIVVSGEEGVIKPDPRIFEIACERFGLVPDTTVFVDDAIRNVEGARAFGMHAIHFTSPAQLRSELRELRLL